MRVEISISGRPSAPNWNRLTSDTATQHSQFCRGIWWGKRGSADAGLASRTSRFFLPPADFDVSPEGFHPSTTGLGDPEMSSGWRFRPE